MSASGNVVRLGLGRGRGAQVMAILACRLLRLGLGSGHDGLSLLALLEYVQVVQGLLPHLVATVRLSRATATTRLR